MDLAFLEQQLKEVRDRKKEISTELQNIQRKYNKIENIIGSEWWYVNNHNVYIVNNGSQLTVEIPEDKHLYISYMEKNNDFSIAPSKPIFLSENDIEYLFKGTITDHLKATLHLIGYKNNQKVGFYKLTLNESGILNVDLNKYDYFRVAVKLTGSGTFSLQSIKIGDHEIEGFKKTGFSSKSNLRDESPTLNIEKHFSDVIDLASISMNIPLQFTPFLQVESGVIKSNLKGNRYGYIQYNDKGPIFGVNNLYNCIKVTENNLYEFGFSATTDGNTNVELILLGFNEEKAIEAKLVKNNSTEFANFKDDTKFVKLLFRIQGQGEVANVKVGINRQERVPNYALDLEKNPVIWLNPKDSQVELQRLDNQMIISSAKIENKPTYISYDAKNNSFSKVPEKSIFEVNNNCNYEIMVKGERNGSGTIQPIIITYSSEKKEDILNLTLNELNKVEFKENIVKVRISFKVLGNAQLKLDEFNIKEFSNVEEKEVINWSDSKEPFLLGLTKKKPLSSVKMAAIFDEFTMECYTNECNLITFTPDNWKEILTVEQPDLLMVESAWRGNGGAWIKKVQYTDEDSIKDLRELINWCNTNNVPTVFWNKEDPVHYDHFIETAKLFDFVYTSDESMVPVYKEACGHDRVSSLMFAAQPAIHNPITIGKRQNGISFAGSFYKKHIERSEDMLKIFNQALNHNLVIYDRNYEKIKQGLLPNNRFPDYLTPYIKGSLKYYEIDKAYKGFKAMVNINTVKNSPTMFARRVFEALASGTPVISNYSEGIKRVFGDIVYASDDEQNIKADLESIFENEQEYKSTVIKGIREVLEKHTYAHRLEQIIKFIQLPFKKEATFITVFAFAQDLDAYEEIMNSYKKQNLFNKSLKLLVSEAVFNNIEMNTDSTVEINEINDYMERNSNIVELVEGEYFTIFSANEKYNEDYLKDLSHATLYAPWEIITSNPNKDLVFEQSENIAFARSLFKVGLFKTQSLSETFEALTKSKDLSLSLKMGARVLELPY